MHFRSQGERRRLNRSLLFYVAKATRRRHNPLELAKIAINCRNLWPSRKVEKQKLTPLRRMDGREIPGAALGLLLAPNFIPANDPEVRAFDIEYSRGLDRVVTSEMNSYSRMEECRLRKSVRPR